MAKLRVHTAASGEEAIARAHRVHPDLILMDIMMPGLDGPSTLTRMRSDASLPYIPVIFMTAKLLPAEVAHFLRLGALGVIGKRFDPLKLSDELFLLWRRSGAAQTIYSVDDDPPPADVRAKIVTLTDALSARTANDVSRLAAMIERAREGKSLVLQDIGRMAHKIHGSGAVFGFPKLSALGAAIDCVVDGGGTT